MPLAIEPATLSGVDLFGETRRSLEQCDTGLVQEQEEQAGCKEVSGVQRLEKIQKCESRVNDFPTNGSVRIDSSKEDANGNIKGKPQQIEGLGLQIKEEGQASPSEKQFGVRQIKVADQAQNHPEEKRPYHQRRAAQVDVGRTPSLGNSQGNETPRPLAGRGVVKGSYIEGRGKLKSGKIR